jgi:hypothetical protein
MAINPELITTIRVDQLPDGTLNLTNKIPHTSGTVLEKASVQELVDLVATAIGVSGGVGYIALSVTDGQQLPDVPELPSFFLCGAGTFLNINGYPNIICTENLNAIMSLTDHWELAVEIPINPLSGTVQTVTGSAVDNTDPLNPVINEIIYGVQNIIAGTNITVDNTDPANPIVSATGGGGSQTLQEVLDNNHDLVDGLNFQGTGAGINNTGNDVNAFGYSAGNGNTFNNVNLFGENATAEEDGQTVLSKDGTIMARISTFELTDTRNYKLPDAEGTFVLTSNLDGYVPYTGATNDVDLGDRFIQPRQVRISNADSKLGVLQADNLTDNRGYQLPDAEGTFALLSDITTPTLQQVTDEGNTTNNSIIINGNNELSVNYGNNLSAVYSSSILSANNSTGSFAILSSDGNVGLGNASNYQTSIAANNLTNNAVQFELPNKTIGTYTLATISDIPTGGGGIPHATAAGTDTYTATITGVAAYNDADAYLIRFTNGNTSGATLNINSLGAKTLYRNNDGALIGGDIINGGEMLCIYNTSLNGFQVIGTAPNSLFAYVTNDDSVTLTKGMPVYAFSGTGDRMTVKRANNTLDSTSAQTVGLVLSTSIAANQKGLIMMQGLLDGLSILPTATFADGDPVYLGATAGTITNVKPYGPNHLVYLGVVTTASNGSAGRMYVRIQNGYELSEIHDIDLITNAPTNNQVLTYESSTDLWKNKSLGTILGYTPYRNVQTSQTSITGTTAETIVFTATIPAGTFNSADVLKILFGANKLNSLSTYSLRLRVNTTNTISGSTTIATYTGSATPQVNLITRNFNLNGGNLYGFMFTTSAITDIAAGAGALNSTTLNPANQFFIFATVQLVSINDSIIGNMFSISN